MRRRPTTYDGNTPGCKGCIYDGQLGTCNHPQYHPDEDYKNGKRATCRGRIAKPIRIYESD